MTKRDINTIQKAIVSWTPSILEARARLIQDGVDPKVIYIGDIFPRKKDELRPSAMKIDTGCKVFGMKIIADYRVPNDRFYILQGEL